MTKEENEKRLIYLKDIVKRLPEKPGSYQYYDADGTIIYVGKAKNLKSRVSSYFHTEVDRFKTKVLVSKIHNITYTVVNTEEDALLLENSLIKKYNPKYNVLLKDGKTYPWICITGEMFPRVFTTRTVNKKWGTYYGPYSHLGSMYAVLELIKKPSVLFIGQPDKVVLSATVLLLVMRRFFIAFKEESFVKAPTMLVTLLKSLTLKSISIKLGQLAKELSKLVTVSVRVTPTYSKLEQPLK